MNTGVGRNLEKAELLAEAFRNAGKQLGMSQSVLGEIVGKNRSMISRGRIDPASKTGESALLFIRCYRALHVLVGGDQKAMRHWMNTENVHTGGVPAEQVKTVQGLIGVLEYLDAIQGKP